MRRFQEPTEIDIEINIFQLQTLIFYLLIYQLFLQRSAYGTLFQHSIIQ